MSRCRLPSSRRAWAVLLASTMLGAGAFAQPAEKTYDGTWSVRLTAPDGKAQAATLVLKAYDGTWQDRSGSRRAAPGVCAGKKIPISVQASTPTALVFTVWGEAVTPSCPTLTVMLTPRGDTLLEGPVDLGSHGSESPEVHASHSGQAVAGTTPSRLAGTAGTARLTLRR